MTSLTNALKPLVDICAGSSLCKFYCYYSNFLRKHFLNNKHHKTLKTTTWTLVTTADRIQLPLKPPNTIKMLEIIHRSNSMKATIEINQSIQWKIIIKSAYLQSNCKIRWHWNYLRIASREHIINTAHILHAFLIRARDRINSSPLSQYIWKRKNIRIGDVSIKQKLV